MIGFYRPLVTDIKFSAFTGLDLFVIRQEEFLSSLKAALFFKSVKIGKKHFVRYEIGFYRPLVAASEYSVITDFQIIIPFTNNIK